MEKEKKLFILVSVLALIAVLGWWSWITTEQKLIEQLTKQQEQKLIFKVEKLEFQQKLLEIQLRDRQNFAVGESIIVEILESPKTGETSKVKSFEKGTAATYIWEFRITNPSKKSIEMIYDILYPKSGYSGAVVLDPDGPGPYKEFYYSFGQKALLKSQGEHNLYLSLALPPGVDPNELEITFGIYYGPRG